MAIMILKKIKVFLLFKKHNFLKKKYLYYITPRSFYNYEYFRINYYYSNR